MWIARDKDGSLWLYTEKPIKGTDMWLCEDFNNSKCLEISNKYINGNFQLPEVTWENSPKEVIIKPEESEGEIIRTDKELVEEVFSHIESIKDTVDRMTSGNFMHNNAAIKFSANTIMRVLELMGLNVQNRE